MTKENMEQVIEPLSEMDLYKSQLAQSLELTEKLINDLEQREKEIELFSRIRESLENTIKVKDQEIEQFKAFAKEVELEKFSSRMNSLADSWIHKYQLSEDKKSDVLRMLTTFQSEDELNRVERLLGLSLSKERNAPVALTRNSDALAVEQFSNRVTDYNLTQQDRVDLLWKKLKAIESINNP